MGPPRYPRPGGVPGSAYRSCDRGVPHDGLEICYSARNQADLEALLAGQQALEWLPVTQAVMDRALEVQRLLAAHTGNGHRRPIPDLIIAATAELHDAEILHVDTDYELIAQVTSQPTRRLFNPARP